MGGVDLPEIVERILVEWADYLTPRIAPADQDVQPQLLFDRERGQYALFEVGWKGHRRFHGLIAHLSLINGKVWIQEDNTETGIAADLERAGVPKSRIVLGFRHASARPHTDYAVA